MHRAFVAATTLNLSYITLHIKLLTIYKYYIYIYIAAFELSNLVDN